MSIDRDALARVIGRGEQPAYSIVPPGTAGYHGAEAAWAGLTYEEKLNASRDILAGSGYDAANPLSVSLLHDVGGIHEKVAAAVASMWVRHLPVDVSMDKREWKYFLDTRDRRDEWQVMRFSWFGDYDDPETFLDLFRSDSPQNLSRIDNREFDEKLLAANSTLDSAERNRLLAEAESLMLAEDAIAPLYFYVSKHLVSESVLGFEDNAVDRHPSRYLRFSAASD